MFIFLTSSNLRYELDNFHLYSQSQPAGRDKRHKASTERRPVLLLQHSQQSLHLHPFDSMLTSKAKLIPMLGMTPPTLNIFGTGQRDCSAPDSIDLPRRAKLNSLFICF
ncbi:hypothetical protein RRG08_019875 [Elysia crispata]|uniref:Uncharacterized protein n=1 Tax=Elysia crispata TaxID=231223 RepID=A0AAE0Z8D5_9GAST|nr:hypothetical protein RRG08_019875 [Elysia crispata]